MNHAFDRITRILLVVLPFHVLISVFFGHKLGIPGVSAYKEILIVGLFAALAWDFYRRRLLPRFDLLDYAVGAYVAYLLVISLVNGVGLSGLVAGARYDFEFLFVLLLYKHGVHLLPGKFSEYVRLFVVSATAAVLIGMFVRFVTKETILIPLGFSGAISDWRFGSSVPIYHGIPNANIRRFQGIFDGPNPAAYFLLVLMGATAYAVRSYRDYWWIVAGWMFVLMGLVLLTYSRSALVGMAVASALTVVLLIRVILRRYKTVFFSAVTIAVLVGTFFYYAYQSSIATIFLRDGSSKGHSERMVAGVERFMANPFGYGLASSGPASRHTYDPSALSPAELKLKEDQTIPESWYVQQLVEGGVVAFVLFLAICAMLARHLFRFHPAFFWSFVAVCTMSVFLHTFEAGYVSILLFMLVGMIVGYRTDPLFRRDHA